MPRPLRVEYEGASYHVMARGNRGCRPFSTEGDVRSFLSTLEEAKEKTGWIIHAWVFMSSHYHLLIETPKPNLVYGMKWLQGAYTQRYNAFHQEWGHLFQGRYKAKVIDSDDPAYFVKVADYIHLNPVVAGLLSGENQVLSDYRQSSYPSYLESPKSRSSMLTTQRVLRAHGIEHDSPKGRRAYEALMQLKMISAIKQADDENWRKTQQRIERGWVHGSKDFRKAMSDYLQTTREDAKAYDGDQQREISEVAAEKALHRGLEVVGLMASELGALKKGDPRKLLLAGWLRSRYPVNRRWITERLSMGHENRVTAGVNMYRDAAGPYKVMKSELLDIVELSG